VNLKLFPTHAILAWDASGAVIHVSLHTRQFLANIKRRRLEKKHASWRILQTMFLPWSGNREIASLTALSLKQRRALLENTYNTIYDRQIFYAALKYEKKILNDNEQLFRHVFSVYWPFFCVCVIVILLLFLMMLYVSLCDTRIWPGAGEHYYFIDVMSGVQICFLITWPIVIALFYVDYGDIKDALFAAFAAFFLFMTLGVPIIMLTWEMPYCI